MENGSGSETLGKAGMAKGNEKLDSVPSKIEPFVPRTDHNPRELKSWAKRTGFISNFSGETTASISDIDRNERMDSHRFDLEKGPTDQRGGASPKIEIDPFLGRAKKHYGN